MLASMAIDPIALTKQLVDIESTTYNEGACGEFLSTYLSSLGWSVERQHVPQPDPAKTPGGSTGPRFNVYASQAGTTPDVVVSPPTSTPSHRSSDRARKTQHTYTAAVFATPRASSLRR